MTVWQPLVSIVVPVYNGAAYLRESLESILGQTYPHIEILVMDDASTDETPRIAQQYAGRIHYHRHASTLGQFGNVNAGIERAGGELIAVFHADDIYLPEIVEREVACFAEWPEVGAVFCKDIFIDAAGLEYRRLLLPPEVRGSRPLPFDVVFNALLTYQNAFLVCPSAMVRASVYRDVGTYQPDVWRDSADLEMWIRIARRFPVLVLDEYLMKYRHFPMQAHRRYNRLRTEPALHFTMMERFLREGADRVATREALRAHAAHRAEDRLLIAVNMYIRGDRHRARSAAGSIRLREILGSARIARTRILALYGLLSIVCRLPRSPLLAALFEWRWQSGRTIGRTGPLSGLGATIRRWWQGQEALT